MNNYISIFHIASGLDSFMKKSLINHGKLPGKVTLEIMLWRWSHTTAGEVIINLYKRALFDPTLWNETAAIMLQSLTSLFQSINLCARTTNYQSINSQLGLKDKTKLKDIVADVSEICKRNDCNCDSAIEYILECRNVFVHSGIIPYVIYGKNELGLNTFLRHRFKIDRSKLDSAHSRQQLSDEKEWKKYQAFCNIILSILAFYFVSVNPALSKYRMARFVGLSFVMTISAISEIIAYFLCKTVDLIRGSLALLRIAFLTCILGAIVIVIMVIVSNIIGLFSDNTPHPITKTNPQQLTQWIDEIAPYEQMEFLKLRKSSLNADYMRHRIGDKILSPADARTEQLYEIFKDFPDPKVHPVGKLIPNPGHLARISFLGWPLSKQWGGEAMFTSADSAWIFQKNINKLPIYQGELYPIISTSANYVPIEKLLLLGKRLSAYKKLTIHILYGTAEQNKNTADLRAKTIKQNKELAQNLKELFVTTGVPARKILIEEDPTNLSEVTIAVGGVDSYVK